MRETFTSGSVGVAGGNPGLYPELDLTPSTHFLLSMLFVGCSASELFVGLK